MRETAGPAVGEPLLVVGALMQHPSPRAKARDDEEAGPDLGAGEEPRLFLARRAGGRHAGLWELPGGKVEAGEGPASALLRELREELGLEARITGAAARYEALVEGRSFVFLVFPVDPGGEPRFLRDHDRWRYVPRGRLGDYPLAPLDSPPVTAWAEGVGDDC